MFHVKHFGTILAAEYSRHHTSEGLRRVELRGKLVFWAVDWCGHARRLRHPETGSTAGLTLGAGKVLARMNQEPPSQLAISGEEQQKLRLLLNRLAGLYMDDSEKLCKEYLKYIGYSEIAYEPDGNVTPDFLVEGRIAVEVRRLNPIEAAQRATDREFKDSEIPLRNTITALLEEFGPPTKGASWFVMCEFSSTLTQSKEWKRHWKKLEKEARRKLERFKKSATHSNTVLWVGDALKLKILRTSAIHEYFYILGMCIDDSPGIRVSSAVKQNIEFCIEQKQKQFEKSRNKYPVWWFVLVDYINFGYDPELYEENISIPHNWDKIILINPLDPTRAFAIK